MKTIDNSISPDTPIVKASEDLLNRAPLAKNIASMILNIQNSNSVVIGIESPWGTGKTSFVNMILEKLDGKVYQVKFNPWNFADESILLNDFINAFSIIPPIANNRKLKFHLRGYLSKLTNISLNLGFFSFNFAGSTKFDPISKHKKEIDRSLKRSLRKIVVLIDDIDRLDSKDTKLIFKLVKLTANFPKTIFILCYDRMRVENILTEKNNTMELSKEENNTEDYATVRGSEYLKKIVQVSFLIPDVDKIELRELILKNIDIVMKGIYGNLDIDDTHWNKIFHSGFKNLFKTMRDINRYINSLQLSWSLVSSEDVNRADFLGIEAIRVFAPKFFEDINSHKYLFTGVPDRDSPLLTDKDMEEKTYHKLLDKIPLNLKSDINNLCKQLFPQIHFGTSYDVGFNDKWRKELRICSYKKFDFYFKLAIPRDSVTENEFYGILKTLGSQKSFMEKLHILKKENKIHEALRQLRFYIEDTSPEKLRILILGCWGMGDYIKYSTHEHVSKESIETEVFLLCHNATKLIEVHIREKFIANLIKESEHIYPAIEFASYLVAHVGDKLPDVKDEPILTISNIDKVRDVAIDKLKKYAADGKLILHNDLYTLLLRWGEIGSETEVSKFISNILKDKSDTSNLLACAVTTGYYEPQDSQRINTRKINLKFLNTLYPIEKIEKVVESISDTELEAMNERQKEAIQLFRSEYIQN